MTSAKRILLPALCLLLFLVGPVGALAAKKNFTFSDTRFQGRYTTENLDAIIEEYELYDGWYWCTRGDEIQTFHGVKDCPGWTYTAAEIWLKTEYMPHWYGCRWGTPRVREEDPDKGGYGECFGFAQFIGYLLSGEVNPQGRWKYYYTMEDAGGLQPGDILRVEYKKEGRKFQHSAVVYSVSEEEVLFLQASGSGYNRISVGVGFSDGNVKGLTDPEELAHLSWLRISRPPISVTADKPMSN